MIHIANPSKPSGGGKRVARFTVGTSTAGWTAADCDYLCDGTDDQVEINAAIQALPATGGEVVILDGTYNITARVTVGKSRVAISGNGATTILKRMYAESQNGGVIDISASHTTIRDISVEGNPSFGGSRSFGIYIRVSDCSVQTSVISAHYVGVYAGMNNHLIWGNRLFNNDDSGIYLSGSNGTICGNVSYSNLIGIRAYGAGNSVTGNICSNNTYGIYIDGSRNSITGNTCRDNTNGIYLNSAKSCVIVGNVSVRGTGGSSDYTSSQYTIRLYGTSNTNNLIAYNLIMGKNYTSEGGTGNTFTGNKYN